jgi:hypothetical protein
LEISLYETGSLSTTTKFVDINRFFKITESRVPDDLIRSFSNEYLFGLYALEKNEPFLIFKTNSYANAYKGMIDWEETMFYDLGPIFIDDAISVKTDDSGKFFIDKIYFNKDTRAIFDSFGNPVMLWSIINRNTVVVTTNGDVLDAISKKLTVSNIVR